MIAVQPPDAKRPAHEEPVESETLVQGVGVESHFTTCVYACSMVARCPWRCPDVDSRHDRLTRWALEVAAVTRRVGGAA